MPTPNSRPHDPRGVGRIDLVYGPVGERARAARSEDGTDQGIRAQDSGLWSARSRRGQGRQHLVHREIRRHSSASSIRRPDRSPNIRCPIRPRRIRIRSSSIRKGTLWFTVQGANMVGRMNPATGELALRNSPTSKSLPYGIMVNSKGVPFFVEFGANKIASIDPATMVIREWTLPDSGVAPAPPRHRRAGQYLVFGLFAWISRPARSGDVAGEGMGIARRGRSRSRTALPSSTARSGTANPASSRTRSSCSILRQRSFRRGRFPRAAESCGMSASPKTATSRWLSAASTRSGW